MSGSRLRIVYPHAGGRGWDTVTTMVHLSARLLGGEVHQLGGFPSMARQALGMLPRRTGRDDCLLICPEPYALTYVLGMDHLLRGHRRVVAWIVDSFWDDRIPHVARHRGHLDHLFITDYELLDSWQRQTGVETSWLPFGADVLGRGRDDADRPFDLQVIGRQPDPWSDAATTVAAGERVGVRIAPTIPYLDGDPEGNQEGLRRGLARAKFTLAFSNGAAPAGYTHHTREYVTGRWTEALAVGSTVAGIAPRCHAAEAQFWPGATLELGTTERARGLDVIGEAVSSWTPQAAVLNYRMALRRLDWRWRLAQLAEALDRPAPLLDVELATLRQRLDSFGEGPWRA